MKVLFYSFIPMSNRLMTTLTVVNLKSHMRLNMLTELVLSCKYHKCSKILNNFLFLFSKMMLVIRAGIHKMLVRIANREDPDQTASSEAV